MGTPNHCGEWHKVPTLSQIPSSIQYICFRKDLRFGHGSAKPASCPRCHLTSLHSGWLAAVATIALRWRSNYYFSFMLLCTLHSTKLQSLPLLAVIVSQHFLPKVSAFKSHMRQNAYDRNWTFKDLFPCYFYAKKSNDRTIRSQALQPASTGEVENMSKLQDDHFITPEQRTYLLCNVSYRQMNCYCKN